MHFLDLGGQHNHDTHRDTLSEYRSIISRCKDAKICRLCKDFERYPDSNATCGFFGTLSVRYSINFLFQLLMYAQGVMFLRANLFLEMCMKSQTLPSRNSLATVYYWPEIAS